MLMLYYFVQLLQVSNFPLLAHWSGPIGLAFLGSLVDTALRGWRTHFGMSVDADHTFMRIARLWVHHKLVYLVEHVMFSRIAIII